MNHEESNIQSSAVVYFKLQYPQFDKLLFSIPNGAFLNGNKIQRIKQWKRLEKEGAKKGIADLFLSIPNDKYHGLYLECKTSTGKQSEDQKEFEKKVIVMGFDYKIFRSLDEFQYIVNHHIINSIWSRK